MIVPALSALFSDSIWDELCDKGPLFRAVLINDFDQQFILFLCPLLFSEH